MSGNQSQARGASFADVDPVLEIKTFDIPIPQKTVTPPSGNPLFATQPIVDKPMTNPVIVVGLPRSGSSFLAYVLSQIEDLYVFDDFYLYREVKAMKIDGPLTDQQLKKLLFFLGWVLRARVKWPSIAPPKYTLEDIDLMCLAVEQTFEGKYITWNQLMEEWLTRLARFHGCRRWGYKAPQDFMHLPMLKKMYPDVRFIFLMRDPRKMMASMKFVDKDDGSPMQYHPLAYAYYWKMAVTAMTDAKKQFASDVCDISFEQLRDHPAEQCKLIADFLDMKYYGEIGQYKTNTSFAGKRKYDITPTEKWICEWVAGDLMERAGYGYCSARPRFRDIPDLLWVTIRFCCYQMYRAIFKKSRRQSIVAFIKTAFRYRPAEA